MGNSTKTYFVEPICILRPMARHIKRSFAYIKMMFSFLFLLTTPQLVVEGSHMMAPRISRFDMAMDAKFQQATATLDLTGKERREETCFDTCKEYPGCGGVYIKDTTCHLVDKSVTNQTNSLVAEPGTNSYLLKELSGWDTWVSPEVPSPSQTTRAPATTQPPTTTTTIATTTTTAGMVGNVTMGFRFLNDDVDKWSQIPLQNRDPSECCSICESERTPNQQLDVVNVRFLAQTMCLCNTLLPETAGLPDIEANNNFAYQWCIEPDPWWDHNWALV